MGRPAKKRTYVEAKARRRGELQAEREMRRNEPIQDTLKEHALKLVDRIDPIETAAILGTTLIVHGLISDNQAWVSKALEYGKMWSTEQASEAIADWLKGVAGQEQKARTLLEMPDWAVWLTSLSIAYIVIKHGGQLIGLLDKGLSAVVPLLLGA